METRILGSFEPGTEKGPSIKSANPQKRGFAQYNTIKHYFCTLSSWNSTVLPELDFSFWSGKKSNFFNARIERPNNQEPVLGTDERAIIFKTPFKLFGWKSEYELQQLSGNANLNFRVALVQEEKSCNIQPWIVGQEIELEKTLTHPCKKEENWPRFTPRNFPAGANIPVFTPGGAAVPSMPYKLEN